MVDSSFFSSSVQDQTKFEGEMATHTRVTKKSKLVVVALISAVVLSGCTAPDRGQSIDSAAEQISEVEGVIATTKSGGSYSGWVFERWSSAQITLEAGSEIKQWREFLIWAVHQVWSMNEDSPSEGVTVSITFSDRAVFENWQQQRDSIGLPSGYSMSERDREIEPKITVAVPRRFADEAGLGPWPGKVPTLPDNVIAKVSDE